MNGPRDESGGAPRAVRAALTAVRWLALGTIVVAGLVLAGWVLDIATLKSVAPGLVSMKANTAIGFLLCGMALLLRGSPWWHAGRGSGIATAVVCAIGALTLLQYLTDLHFGIDELVFRDNTAAADTSHPGRMAPATALNFLLAGIALATLRRMPLCSRVCAVAVLVLGLLAFCGYLFGVEALYRFSDFTSMALHTAVLFRVVGLALIAARPDRGWVRVVVSPTAGGVVARQLLPAVPVTLLALGGLSLAGERLGYYESAFALVLVVVGGMVVVTVMVLLVARRLEQIDQARHRARRDLDTINATLERAVEARTAALTEANQRLAQEVEERRRAEAHVRELSITDELTGLFNRRGFLLLAEQELRTCRRNGTDCAIYYLDLDGLKAVNDNQGHEAGDRLLCGMAEVLTWTCREADVIARLGGDEFAILVADPGDSEGLINRLRGAAADHAATPTGAIGLRFSIGYALCSSDEDCRVEALLRQADARMYDDKRRRRRSGAAGDNPEQEDA